MPVKKSAAKKKPAKKSGKKPVAKKASKLVCGVCGFGVTVDNLCGCAEAHPIICCGKAMKKK